MLRRTASCHFNHSHTPGQAAVVTKQIAVCLSGTGLPTQAAGTLAKGPSSKLKLPSFDLQNNAQTLLQSAALPVGRSHSEARYDIQAVLSQALLLCRALQSWKTRNKKRGKGAQKGCMCCPCMQTCPAQPRRVSSSLLRRAPVSLWWPPMWPRHPSPSQVTMLLHILLCMCHVLCHAASPAWLLTCTCNVVPVSGKKSMCE